MTSLVLHVGSLRTNWSFRMLFNSDPWWDKVSAQECLDTLCPWCLCVMGCPPRKLLFEIVSFPMETGFLSSCSMRKLPLSHSTQGKLTFSPSPPWIFSSLPPRDILPSSKPSLLPSPHPTPMQKTFTVSQGPNSGESGSRTCWDLRESVTDQGSWPPRSIEID